MQCSEQTRRWATALSKMVFSRHREAGFLWTGIVRLLSVYAESAQANSSPSKNQSGNLWAAVKLGFQTEMSGPKSCKALASTCRLRRSLDGCLKFRRSGQSRRVQSRAEKKLKKGESELREVGC